MVNYSPKTNLENLIYYLSTFFRYFTLLNLNNISIEVLSLLSGFFVSAGLSSITVHSRNWSILAALLIVIGQEISSQVAYSEQIITRIYNKYLLKKYLKCFNNIKIGLIYGLFVDAFKLGS